MKARGPMPPDRAGRRRDWTEIELAALDFETTGLDVRKDAVVSFGVVPVSGGRVALAGARYHEVFPQAPLSHRSITIHELRPQDLAGAPVLDIVLDDLRDALDRRFLLTWTAEIEIGFLRQLFGGTRHGWARRMIDVWRLALVADRLMGTPPGSGESLTAVAKRLGVPLERAHHALGDALMTAEVFLILASKLQRYGYGSVASFLRETRGAARVPRRAADPAPDHSEEK